MYSQQAHDAAVSKLSWTHPEFGSIIASSSFDRTFKIWEETNADTDQYPPQVNGAAISASTSSSRWVERSVNMDAKGTVRAVEFAPHQFGLKLVGCLQLQRYLGMRVDYSRWNILLGYNSIR